MTGTKTIAEWLEGYYAYRFSQPDDISQSEDWRMGWKFAADADKRNQEGCWVRAYYANN